MTTMYIMAVRIPMQSKFKRINVCSLCKFGEGKVLPCCVQLNRIVTVISSSCFQISLFLSAYSLRNVYIRFNTR